MLLWHEQVAILANAGALPWLVKPVYGFLSDTIPIWGLRRRPYLILGGFVGVLTALTVLQRKF